MKLVITILSFVIISLSYTLGLQPDVHNENIKPFKLIPELKSERNLGIYFKFIHDNIIYFRYRRRVPPVINKYRY